MKVTIVVRTHVEADMSYDRITQYLEGKGWQRAGPWTQYGTHYVNNDNSVVVAKEIAGDFRTRMNELVWDLAEIENRSQAEVLADLTRE